MLNMLMLGKEVFEEKERDVKSPLPQNPSISDRVWEIADDVESALVNLFNTDITGPEWGKAVQSIRDEFGKVADIPIKEILGTEPTLERDHLIAVLKDTHSHQSSHLPVLYDIGNYYVVGDGNHRIAADLFRKKKTTRALVLDLFELIALIKD